MIDENNKLIAEFMGWEHSKNEDIDAYEMSNLKYHTSWDWLMPVVKRLSEEMSCGKIEELHDFYELFYYGLYEANINKVYSAILQFIQWFNTQNTTK